MPGNSALEAPSARVTPPAPGAGVNATWTYTLGSVVFFLAALDALLVLELADRYARSQAPVDLALTLAVFVASAVQVRYCWFLRAGRLPHAGWTLALFAPAAIAWVVAFVQPETSLMATVPLWLAVSLLVCLIPAPRRWQLLALAAVTVALPVIVHWPTGAAVAAPGNSFRVWLVMLYAAGMPLILLTSLWWWRVVMRLDESRRVAAELAVAQERLRFASDLHDIQGHHLQVIALKSELAERLLEPNPAAAAAQVHEIRVIAKQALEETRSLVAGLREVALADELENAREVLSLAGADCTLDLGMPELDALPTDPRAQRALALTVREGTTNILRHSAATAAAITLRRAGGACELELVNNGVGSSGSGPDGAATSGAGSPSTAGSGLAGLRHRVEELGGTLTHTREADRFTLCARVPLHEEAVV